MKKYYITPKEKKKIDEFSYYDLESVGHIDDVLALNDFIEEKLIEKFCNKRKRLNKNQYKIDSNYHCSIALNKLISLGFTKEEFDYIMNYLNKLGIIVSGYDTELIGLFENYECIKKDFLIGVDEIRSRLISKSDTNLLLDTYSSLDNKRNPEAIRIRNKIVEGNLGLVSVAIKYVPKLISLSDIESYGYMGLILCVENYKPEFSNAFDTYAVCCIRRYVVKMLIKTIGISNYDLYRMFLNGKSTVDRNFVGVDRDDIEFLNELFIELGLDENSLENYSTRRKATMLKFKYNINRLYNNYLDDMDYLASIELPVDEEVDIKLLQDKVNEVLNDLTEEEREIIYLRYGFFGEDMTYTSMGKWFGKMRETVRKKCIRTEEKLKRHKEMQILSKTYLK